MKRKRIGSIFFVFLLTFLLNGCVEEDYSNLTLDIAAVGTSWKEEVNFEDELVELMPMVIETIYGFKDAVKVVAYAGSGATAEEILLIEAADSKTAETYKTQMDDYLKKQITKFTDYNPKEMPKLDAPILEQRGKYVFYCITADRDTAMKILEKNM